MQLRALFAMQGLLGCRVSEARGIVPSDFDFETMTVRVFGKGQKERYLPLSDDAWKYIAPAYAEAEAGNSPLISYTDRGARAAVTGMGKKLGLKRPIASHDLRATVATAMYDKTKDVRMVQEFLGHASVETTQIYTKVNMDNMRKAMSF